MLSNLSGLFINGEKGVRLRHQFESMGRSVKARAGYYRRIYRHPDTPWPAKVLLWCAIGYTLSPIDIIPDFIPVIGHLDDLVIVPALILLALRFVPDKVKIECKQDADSDRERL